jgi:hypothetical protein
VERFVNTKAALALIGMALLGGCAATPDTTAGPVVPNTGEKLANAKVICRTEYPVGSHRPERVCTTQQMRDEMKRGADETMDNIRSRPTVCNPSGVCE